MNKLSSLRDACGLTLIRAGGKNPDFLHYKTMQKKNKTTKPNNKAAALFPSGVFHYTRRPKNKGKILFFLFSSIYLFCALYVSIMHQA